MSITKNCSIENCDTKTVGRGLCSKHWKHWRRHGNASVNKLEMHGMAGYKTGVTAEYRTWAAMKSRCYNPNNNRYHRYGGRGIEVCDRWRDSFIAFYEDMGMKPSSKHTIDRIDVDGNYELSNCRWETYSNQGNNTSTNRLLTLNGETHTQHQWSIIIGISESTISARRRKGWSVEKALTLPLRRKRQDPSQP